MITSTDVFFSQSAAFSNVILGTVGERVADVTIREKKTPQEPVDSLTKFIAELQKRQNTLKTVAEKCKLKQKQVELETKREFLDKLPKDRYSLLGSSAVIAELKHCAAKAKAICTVASSQSDNSGSMGSNFDIVKLSIPELVTVEIIVLQSGGSVQHVAVTSSNLPCDVVLCVSEKFSQLLKQAKYNEFGKFFKSWIGLYCDNIGDSVNLKLRPKVISAISALLSDIEALNKSFIVGLDPSMKSMIKSVVHGNPCGLFAKIPQAPKPLIKFYVNPYDVMKFGKSMESDISDLPANVGITAHLEFQQINSPKILSEAGFLTSNNPSSKSSNSVRKVQVAPLVTSIQPLKIAPTLNINNSSPMPVAFCLTFHKPMPLFACYVKELQEFTKSLLLDSKEPLNWLYAMSAYQGVVPDYAHEYAHALPSCDLLTLIDLDRSCEEVKSATGCYMVQSVLFTHVNPLPHIVHIMRKQAAINSLIGELMRKQALPGTAKHVDVVILSVEEIQIMFTHPLKASCKVTVEVKLLHPDFANPSCKVTTSDGVFVCDDTYATTILRKCGSLAHLTRSILRKCNSLNIDVCTPPQNPSAKVAPPLTPTIDVKSVICFDKSSIDNGDLDTTGSSKLLCGISNVSPVSVQSMKLSDMLQSDTMSPASLQFDEIVNHPVLMNSQSILSSSHAPTSSGSSSAAAHRKRSRAKSIQDEEGAAKGVKVKQTKVKKSMSVAGPAPSLPSSSPSSLQFQQFQMLSMITNNQLFMTSAMLPPPLAVTPEILPNSSSASQSSPNSTSTGSQESKLREILNSPKGTPGAPSTPNPLSGLPFNPPSFDAMNQQRHSGTPPAMSPMHPEFLLNQQAALAMQFQNMYGRGMKPSGMFSPVSGLHNSMDPSQSSHSSFNYPPNLAPFLQQSISMPGGFNIDSKSICPSPSTTITPSSTPDVHNSNSNSMSVDFDMHGRNNFSSTIVNSEEKDRERAMKHLAELIKQLENKNNLSNAEIEAIELQMNQISTKLREAGFNSGGKFGQNFPGTGNKRKGSHDFTDSSSVSSNQSLNESRNSTDSVFTVPTKKSKNTGPPKRRGRPPKGEGQSPIGQLGPKFNAKADSASNDGMSGTGTSPVKKMKASLLSSGSKNKSEFDAFEMSDDSSDSNMAALMMSTVPKKPKAPKKKNPKKMVQPNAEASESSTTTTYKSLNKSDTVLVIKKLQVQPASSAKDEHTPAASSLSGGTAATTMSSHPPSTVTQSSVGSLAVASPYSSLSGPLTIKEDKVSSEPTFGNSPGTDPLQSNISLKPSSATSGVKEQPFSLNSKTQSEATKQALSLENKSSPMKNLLASFTAETAGVGSIPTKVTTGDVTSVKELSSSKMSSTTKDAISSVSNVSVTLASKDSAGTDMLPPTNVGSKSPSSSSPTKKRPGLESVVNKLAGHSPGSAGSHTSPVSHASSSTGMSIKPSIVANTLLKPGSLKTSSGVSSKSESKNKMKTLSLEKTKSEKSSSKILNPKPGSPIASTLPAFLKSTNKLSNFVIPKKKTNSSGSGSGGSSDSGAGSSVESGANKSTVSNVTPASSVHSETKEKLNSAKLFDFPSNDESSVAIPPPPTAPRSSAKPTTGTNSTPLPTTPNSSGGGGSSLGFSAKGALSIPLSRVSGVSLKPVLTRSPIDQDPKPLNLSADADKLEIISEKQATENMN